MTLRPSTTNQHFACRTINTFTGIPLPNNYADDFYACHAYIGLYYSNAKFIRDLAPTQRADWQEPAPPVQYHRERYVELHEAIDTALAPPSPTADPLCRPVQQYQHRAMQFIREQLGILPPHDATRYYSAATEFINAHYPDARHMQQTFGSIYNSGHPNHDAALIARQAMDRLDQPNAMNTLTREQFNEILQAGAVAMPTGLEYEAPSSMDPMHARVRRWVNPGFGRPQPITEESLIGPQQVLTELGWYAVDENTSEPDDKPSEETLKDLIARQFTTTKEE